MNPETVRQLLMDDFADAEVHVQGADGVHFEALIVTPDFEGLSRIQRHRRVYQVLGAHIDSNALHALSMKLLTPAEYADRREA